MSSKDLNILISVTCECVTLCGKGSFANRIKYLEMRRLPWIIQLGSKYHMGP